ncbi:MAG: SsrA-binding protein SmpB [Rickettsiales bacterium]|nr:SsrA-binding protein SmpB [Rickettsiales bacterium]
MTELKQDVIATNRKARHDYHIEDSFEAGIVLQGTEVKALRNGKANIKDSYASVDKAEEVWLINAHIEEYKQGNRFNHEPRRPRKLLLKRKEIKKLIGATQTKGVTLIPLKLYFNHKGIAKVEIGLASGKKKYEKREAIKERDWKRDQARILKEGN